MKTRRNFKKELQKLLDEQVELFNSGTIEQRIEIFVKIQKLQKERIKLEKQEE